jgi:outer membrane murein-binding lipoprotein Lpp
MKLAMQQSQDLKRAKQSIDAMLSGKVESPTKESNSKSSSDKSRPSPTKSKTDLKSHFSEPPAPPPSAPLPEKPDVARALADPIIQPILRRNDTYRPPLETGSPTKADHSSYILTLCDELKAAKGELTTQGEKLKSLEDALAQERTARESAEERAQRAEQGERRDSPRDGFNGAPGESKDFAIKEDDFTAPPDLQAQVDRLRATMDQMKTDMESYRRRAEAAEGERDQARQSLAEMVERKRKENAEDTSTRSSPKGKHSPAKRALRSPDASPVDGAGEEANGHAISPTTPLSPTSDVLLERAGVEEGQPITPEQAKFITQVLAREVLSPQGSGGLKDGTLYYHGRPIASAAVVVMVGMMLMTWMNGWPKVER